MASRISLTLLFAMILAAATFVVAPMPACCPAPPSGKPVVNADQTVIILWDAANQTQHFIRKASFKSDADDFGFIVPSPSRPELEESGNEAFPYLLKLTEPEVKRTWRPLPGIGCSGQRLDTEGNLPGRMAPPVTVIEHKEVAGFHAVVLEATSAQALVTWLKEHGYAFSPEIEAWAQPYVDGGWKFTALKVSKDRSSREKAVAAAALRISFKTERPLFPYREPDPKAHAQALGVKERLLRIYFLAEARYRGELTEDDPWTGRVAWADKLTPEARAKVLTLLKLPADTGPATWWLTEFEDIWPYRAAPADVYFSPDSNQEPLHRPAIIRYYVSIGWPRDVGVYALAAIVLVPFVRRGRRMRAA